MIDVHLRGAYTTQVSVRRSSEAMLAVAWANFECVLNAIPRAQCHGIVQGNGLTMRRSKIRLNAESGQDERIPSKSRESKV